MLAASIGQSIFFGLIMSLACRIEPARRRQSTRTSIQILPERGAGASQIDPKSIPGHSRDAPWRPRASGGRLGSVPGASRGVPGMSQSRPGDPQGRPWAPERTPGSAQERTEVTKIDAKSRPGSKKSFYLWRGECRKRRQSNLSTILPDFRLVREVREPSEVPRLSVKIKVRPFTLRAESIVLCGFKNR